jgi:putative RNA 2'-phosphotransferase
MDSAGWAAIDDVLSVAKVPRALLDAVVTDNAKARYDVRGDHIRASQGHSVEGTPVTLEGLEASWVRVHRTAPLWHGTGIDALASIAAHGLLPRKRTHVHLAGETHDKVGKRSGVDVLLRVDPEGLRKAGLTLFRSPNGVFLTRAVPRSCITDLRAETPSARDLERALRDLFGFA